VEGAYSPQPDGRGVAETSVAGSYAIEKSTITAHDEPYWEVLAPPYTTILVVM
jgi:hypothetical protein